MAGPGARDQLTPDTWAEGEPPHLLVIEARYYTEIADELLKGAAAVIERAGASFERVSVPGVLEIPAAISMAIDGAAAGGTRFDGYVLLGCVIRGDTFHFEIVAGESARALMDLSVARRIPLANGIITVDTEAQAWRRAWQEVIPFFAFGPEIRRVIYTTNAIESLNRIIRKAIKTRGHFPDEQAATKLIYLAIERAETKWRSVRSWTSALAALKIHFGDRLPD